MPRNSLLSNAPASVSLRSADALYRRRQRNDEDAAFVFYRGLLLPLVGRKLLKPAGAAPIFFAASTALMAGAKIHDVRSLQFLEETMSDRLFDPPVFIKDGEYLIREITGPEDAIDVLEEWPEERSDLIHETVLRACRAALDGRKPVSVARNGFVGFARRAGILEDTGSFAAWMRDLKPRSPGVSA